MEALLQSMGYPFLACLLLAGIHVYLGIHVIERKVIFVDLALAQIAAFGAVYGILLGYHLHEDPWAIKGYSLLFAFVGAAVFSITRMRHEKIPHEAIIGITYAVALAATILGSSHLPHGAEEMRNLLAGSILWVRGETIAGTGILYAVIGAFHWIFRRRFLALSKDPEALRREGGRVRLWDFLFYISFGFVVTSSVAIAGVLLVFSFLVIPAVVAMLFAKRVLPRLLLGWTVGTFASFVGVVISYDQDLPSGPTIVLTFGALLVVAALVRYLLIGPDRIRRATRVAIGLVGVVGFVFMTFLFRNQEDESVFEMLRCPAKNERLLAVRSLRELPDSWRDLSSLKRTLLHDPEPEVRVEMLELVSIYEDREAIASIHELLLDEYDEVREAAVRCLRMVNSPETVSALTSAVEHEEDEFIRVEIGEALLEIGSAKGLSILVDLMDQGEVVLVRREAHEHFSAHTEVRFPFQATIDPDENDASVKLYRDWVRKNHGRLQWDESTAIFKEIEP